METNMIDCSFKLRNIEDTDRQINMISQGLGYKDIDKPKALKSYMVEAGEGLDAIMLQVENVHNEKTAEVNKTCDILDRLWKQNRGGYLNALREALGVEFGRFDCDVELHYLPINEIDFKNNKICLDCSSESKDIFITFLIMLAKLAILKVWQRYTGWDFDATYAPQNKIWLFVEIAVDAIFANTKLSGWSTAPSYKYFYNIKLDGVNIMEQFRCLFGKISVMDFLDTVYCFVQDNYKSILEFKNYLY